MFEQEKHGAEDDLGVSSFAHAGLWYRFGP